MLLKVEPGDNGVCARGTGERRRVDGPGINDCLDVPAAGGIGELAEDSSTSISWAAG